MTLSDFLIAHGSALILPLAVIEGPVVSIVTGFLAAQGFISWYWALPVLMCGDLIGDVVLRAGETLKDTGSNLSPTSGKRSTGRYSKGNQPNE